MLGGWHGTDLLHPHGAVDTSGGGATGDQFWNLGVVLTRLEQVCQVTSSSVVVVLLAVAAEGRCCEAEIQRKALRCRWQQDHRGVQATTGSKLCLGELLMVYAALRVILVRHVGVAEEDDGNQLNRRRRGQEREGGDANVSIGQRAEAASQEREPNAQAWPVWNHR